MKILFVRNYPLVDGTFTLLIRLARRMKEDGHESYFLFFSNDIDNDLLKEIARHSSILYFSELEAKKQKGELPVIDAIHGIIAGDSLYTTYDVLKEKYFPAAKVIIGVYHPRAYFTQSIIGPTPDTRVHKRFFKEVPHQNVLFMNDTVKREHENYFGFTFNNSPIIPIPVDIPPAVIERPAVKKNKIVSVGRLVEFKNYISEVIRVVAALNKQGHHFEYHVYGEGPLRKQIEALIASLEAESFIHLHGHLAYTEFRNAVSDALLFVGMGTSVIESSALGVPSLLAVESRDEATYGWYFDSPGYEVGEQVPGQKEFGYRDFILTAYTASDEEYARMCNASREKAKQFSIDNVIRQYYSFITNVDASFSFKVPRWKKLWLKMARQLYKMPWLMKKGYKHK